MTTEYFAIVFKDSHGFVLTTTATGKESAKKARNEANKQSYYNTLHKIWPMDKWNKYDEKQRARQAQQEESHRQWLAS